MYKVNDAITGCVNPDELLEVVDHSLQKALDTDRSVGFCLSGGLDSTTLVKLATRFGRKVDTFSTVFPGTSADESGYLVDAIDEFVDAHIISPPPPTESDIITLMDIQGGPFPSLSLYVQYKLLEYASDYVDVLIDGQGPDELLCGYIGYQSTYVKELFKRGYYTKGIKEGLYSLNYHWRDLLKSRYTDNTQFNGTLSDILTRDLDTSLDLELTWLLKTADYFDMIVESPYTDADVVKYCMDLPYDMKIRNGTSKWVMRQATRGLIPESIRNRQTKLGFPAPEPEWMKGPMRDLVLDSLYEHPVVYKAYINFLKGKQPYSRIMWQTVCKELWERSQE
jgi:asparagine synthase (glutamine-hydrolysing)